MFAQQWALHDCQKLSANRVVLSCWGRHGRIESAKPNPALEIRDILSYDSRADSTSHLGDQRVRIVITWVHSATLSHRSRNQSPGCCPLSRCWRQEPLGLIEEHR
jgi:hypothetical protein